MKPCGRQPLDTALNRAILHVPLDRSSANCQWQKRIASLEGAHKYLATKEDVAELKGELKGLAIKAISIGVPVVLVLIQIVFKYAIP